MIFKIRWITDEESTTAFIINEVLVKIKQLDIVEVSHLSVFIESVSVKNLLCLNLKLKKIRIFEWKKNLNNYKK